MALSGLDIYKLLPKTNCRECGFATCLAFAMQLAKRAVTMDKCPYLSPQAKAALEASALPPIRLVSVGSGEQKLQIGNETVLFRHEEKFRNPAGLGFILEDSLSDAEIKQRIKKIGELKFERIGQKLEANLVAIKQCKDKERFAQAVELAAKSTSLALVLMSEDPLAIKAAAAPIKERRPLLYAAKEGNFKEFGQIAVELKLPLAVQSCDLDTLSTLSKELSALGVEEMVLDTGAKNLAEKIWDLTQLRRQALKKTNRSFGFPVLAVAQEEEPYAEAMEACTYIAKYAGIVLMKGLHAWEALSVLTLRQNIYTDPQKPLQIEPKLYAIGSAGSSSPLLVTTNFSLTYYTVLGEVEASKVPSYILSVDTEGMSVLTAWAAEKFNARSISQSLDKAQVKNMLGHKKIIIPGYVAVMSGDLEEESGFQVIVGPKEAAGIPAFLKNLN